MFRIFVLRQPDVLPEGDAALIKRVRELYGIAHELPELSEKWRPFRSVACWHLWRSIGNTPLD
jgi:DNA-3-methyladenine glycosylase II